jgi:ribosomal protein S18 acetylase RimI-like enzyme
VLESSAIVRSATVRDVPAVLPMVAKICALHEAWDAAKYGFLPNPAKLYERWLIAQVKNDRSVFLIADPQKPEQPDQLAGFLIATTESEIPIYRLQSYGFIHDLWVEPEYRQAGIARKMVEQAIAAFTQMGISQIRLDVATPNETARHLFESCGFRVSTMEMLIELPPP